MFRVRGLLAPVAGVVVAALPLAAHAATSFAVSTVAGHDYTVMGDEQDTLWIKVDNTSTAGEKLNSVTLHLVNADGNNFARGIVAPPGWTYTINLVGVNLARNDMTYTANAGSEILAGQSLIFQTPIQGDLEQPLASAAADIAEAMGSTVCTFTTGTSPQTINGQPTWTRFSYAITAAAAPDSVAPGGSGTISVVVENRSTAAANATQFSVGFPITQTTDTGSATLGAVSPASMNLAAGASGTFVIPYSNAVATTFRARVKVQQGTGTSTRNSPAVSSNLVSVGNLTAALSMSPMTAAKGETVTVTMRVKNNTVPQLLSNGTYSNTAIGQVQPAANPTSVGAATMTYVSGPVPSTVPSLATGETATFTYTYTLAAGALPLQTYAVQGYAVGNGASAGPPLLNQSAVATSDNGTVSDFSAFTNPSAITSSSTGPVAVTVINGSAVTIAGDVIIDYPQGWVLAATQPAVTGYTSAVTTWSCCGQPANSRYRVTYTPTTGTIAPSTQFAFPNTYTTVPTPTGSTDQQAKIEIRLYESGTATGEHDASAILTVTSTTLSIASPNYLAPLRLRKNASSVTGTWTIDAGSTATADLTTKSTPAQTGANSTGYFPFEPGLNSTTSIASPSSVPTGKGWIIDVPGGTSRIPAGTWNFTVETDIPNATLTPGAASIVVAVWKGTVSGGAFTATGTILAPTIDPAAQNLRSAVTPVTTTASYAIPEVTLAANERVFVQYWRYQPTAVNTGTTSRRELDFLVDDGVANVQIPRPADGVTTYTLVAHLASGATPVAGETVQLTSDSGKVSPTSGITDASGNVTFTFTAPASTTNITSTITATRANSVATVSATFTGVAGAGNLLYVGGSLYPRQVAPNTNVAFSIQVYNAGGASITLNGTPPTTLQFTDGTNSYQTTLPSTPITIVPGATATLSFPSVLVASGFVSGQYYPTFSDPVPINDPVTVTGSPTWASVTGLDAEPFGGGVRLSWSTDLEISNTGFQVFRAADGGEPELVEGGWVPASGLSFSDYHYDDVPLANGHWTYWIADVDEDGTATFHGPVSVTLGDAGAGTATGGVASATQGARGPVSGAVPGAAVWTDPSDLGDVRVLEQDDTGLTYEIVPPAYDDTQVAYPDGSHDRLTIAHYGETAEFGKPELPLRQLLVPVPLHSSARLTILSVEETTVSGIRPSWFAGATATADGLVAPPPPRNPALGPLLSHSQGSSTPGLYPNAWASVVDRGAMGDSRIVSLVAAPLRWDATQNLLHVASRIVVRVTFQQAADTALAPATAAENEQARILGGPSLEVSVRDAGVVRVPVAQIAAAGVGAPDSVAVYRNGAAVPSRVVGSELVFLAEAPHSPWTDAAAYWIAPREGGEPTIALGAGAPLPAANADIAGRAFHAEQDLVFGALAAQGLGPDRWYWIQAESDLGTATASFDAPAPVDPTAAASIDVTLQGMYADGTATPDHTVEVHLNGVDLGAITFDGYARVRRTLAVPAGVLVAGANALSLDDHSSSPSRVALDSADLSWNAEANALGAGTLRVRALSSGTLTAIGFAEPPDLAIDETDPAHPTLLGLGTAPDGAGGFAAAVTVAAGHVVRFATPSLPSPATWIARTAVVNPLHNPAGADYVVIAGDGLSDSARGFADYRATATGGNFRATTVAASDLYDRFTFGDRDPAAIHRFLERASLEWPLPRPRYLLLVGDSSNDPLGHTGNAAPSGMLLSARIETSMLDVPSDNATAALGGADLLPDLATGRIPARTPAEVALALAKTKSYEASPHDAVAAREVLLADNELPEFETSATETGALAQGGMAMTLLKAASAGAAPARSSLLQSIADGTALVTYFGHGGVQTWGGEPYLSVGDAPALSNTRLPIVLAVDCLNAYFDHPSADALGEALVRAPGGAAAVWASSAITADGGHLELAAAFHHAFWREPGLRLGDVTRRAMAAVAYRGDAADLIGSYVLFGDPALKLAVNSAPWSKASLLSVGAGYARVSGAGSWDPDGDPLAYHWEILEAPAGAAAFLDGASSSEATLRTDTAGHYRLRLRTADAHVAGPADELAIDIMAAPSAGAGHGVLGCDVGGGTGAAATPIFLLLAIALILRGRRAPLRS